MDQTEYDAFQKFVRGIYEGIAMRPWMYSGHVESIDSFITAIEMILDHFGGRDRPDSYRSFHAKLGFGSLSGSFSGMFAREHHCRLGFYSDEDETLLPREVFADAFQEHWKTFLAARDEYQAGPSE